ncbi:MAG: response regulator, partial [Flavisolibacter sp.]
MAKILVADDESDLEILIKQRFRRQIRENKYQFEFALNGKQALDVLARNSDIDVVLSDINMPEMDGLTLLSNLSERNPLVKTVIVSAYGDMENIRSAMNRGAFDFVCKPVNFEDLELTIEKT